MWNNIATLIESADVVKKEEALDFILTNFPKLPDDKAENALRSFTYPAAERNLRLLAAKRLADPQGNLEIPWVLDRELLIKLAEDPDAEIAATARNSSPYKSYLSLEETMRAVPITIQPFDYTSTALASIEIANARIAALTANSIKQSETALSQMRLANLTDNQFAQSLEAMRASMSVPTWYLQGYAESAIFLRNFADNMAVARQISASIALPQEALAPYYRLEAQAPRLIEKVIREGEQEEGLSEVRSLIETLRKLAEELPIFEDVRDQLSQALGAFEEGKPLAAHSTLINLPEGVLRKIYLETGIGGTSDSLSTMAEQLRAKRFISPQAENLAKAIERDRTDHALTGEHDEYPEQSSRLTILCLLRIGRDYVSYKALRKSLLRIISTDPAYKKFKVEEILKEIRDPTKLHVERRFSPDSLRLTITLFSKRVFQYTFRSPAWNLEDA